MKRIRNLAGITLVGLAVALPYAIAATAQQEEQMAGRAIELPQEAPMVPAVVLVCDQLTLPLPLFQLRFVVVSVSQAPLPGLIVAPLFVLPASHVSDAAEAFGVQKATTASKRHVNTASFCNGCSSEMPLAAR